MTKTYFQIGVAGALSALTACAAPGGAEDEILGVASQALSESLYHEGFESSGYQATVVGDCSVTSAAQNEGSAGLRCNDEASVTFELDASGHRQLSLSYALRIYSYEFGESVITEVSRDGQNYQQVDQLSSAASFTVRTIQLDPTFEDGPLFVRISTEASGYLDRFDLDAVRVTGESACEPGDPGCEPPPEACGGPFVASATEHVAAGRATATTEWCGWFCRRTVFHAQGSDETLAEEGGVRLYESQPGYFTQQSCGATEHPLVPTNMRGISLGEPLSTGSGSGWVFQEVPGSLCRGGSTAGLAIRRGTSDKLMIFLEGGRACFDTQTCSDPLQPSSIAVNQRTPPESGIFDRADPDNPVRDWNMVYIPYCTGDVFTGNRPDTTVPGLSQTQQFVGHRNMRLFLSRLAATFYRADQILLTGRSAGGFGAIANFHQAQQAFDGIGVVHVVDDSGPPLSYAHVPPCLVDRFQALWNLRGVFPPGFDGSLAEAMQIFAQWYPQNTGGVISTTADAEIRMFWGYGQDNCAYFDIGAPLYPAAQYEQGIYEMRDLYMPSSLGTYFIAGEAHTFTGSYTFYDALAGSGAGTIAAWVADILAGEAPRVGP